MNGAELMEPVLVMFKMECMHIGKCFLVLIKDLKMQFQKLIVQCYFKLVKWMAELHLGTFVDDLGASVL